MFHIKGKYWQITILKESFFPFKFKLACFVFWWCCFFLNYFVMGRKTGTWKEDSMTSLF